MESSSETQGHWVGSGEKAGRKFFVLLCPIGEQFLLSSFREFVHDGYCLATLARFVHQACASKGNFFFYFPNHKLKELPMSRKNVWDAISRSNSICPENILFLTHYKCIVNNTRKIKMRRRRRERQISNSLTRQNNNFARASHFFVHFVAVNCTTTRENA